MYIDKKKSYQKYLKFNCKRKEYLLFSKINIKFTTLLFYFYKSIFEIQLWIKQFVFFFSFHLKNESYKMNSHREVSSIREIYLKKKKDNKEKKRF